MPEADLGGINGTVETWLPRIVAAILILIAAYIVGKGVKWALAKGVDKLPGTQHYNEGVDRKKTVGARLGDVAYWLVLLFGVVAALNALELGAVVAPLNEMMTNFFSYVPNIVGAGLIFFVGYLVASLARKVVIAALQAVNLDRFLSRTGAAQVTSGATLSGALGTLVFVLIMIPVTIAALQTLHIDAISQPAIAVLDTILGAIPNVLAAAIVLAIGWLIGKWIAGVIERVLPATGFDRALMSLGGQSSFSRSNQAAGAPPAYPTEPGLASDVDTVPSGGGVSPSKVVANIVLFAIVAFSAIEAAAMLQFQAISNILEDVLSLAGHIVVGGVIITAGVIIADLLANLINRSTQGADRFASTIVRWATIALATAMGLRFMGIADEIVILAFGLILGSAAVAAALAFGLGGREAAGRMASRWLDRAQRQGQAQPAGGVQTREAGRDESRTIPPGGPDARFQ